MIRSGPLDWTIDGTTWPNREASRFVRAAGIRWHVQVMGAGPVLLLAHGTAASTHSWRALAPRLARRFTVLAPDLPGQGFTEPPHGRRYTLPGFASDLAALVAELGLKPDLVVGHSAGAAILCRAVLDGGLAPRGIVSLNGAMLPFGGVTGQIFSPLAKALARTPLALRLLTIPLTTRRAIERMIAEQGSTIEPAGIDLYQRLVLSPDHVAAAFGMMANWDLEPLLRDLSRLLVPLLLVVGSADRAIPPDQARRIRDRVPGARIQELRGLGHLAHEEKPDAVAELIDRFADEVGLGADGPAA